MSFEIRKIESLAGKADRVRTLAESTLRTIGVDMNGFRVYEGERLRVVHGHDPKWGVDRYYTVEVWDKDSHEYTDRKTGEQKVKDSAMVVVLTEGSDILSAGVQPQGVDWQKAVRPDKVETFIDLMLAEMEAEIQS